MLDCCLSSIDCGKKGSNKVLARLDVCLCRYEQERLRTERKKNVTNGTIGILSYCCYFWVYGACGKVSSVFLNFLHYPRSW